MSENKFISELTSLLNKHSRENGSNTPDFILAEFLDSCIDVFDYAINEREKWHGRKSNSPFEKIEWWKKEINKPATTSYFFMEKKDNFWTDEMIEKFKKENLHPSFCGVQEFISKVEKFKEKYAAKKTVYPDGILQFKTERGATIDYETNKSYNVSYQRFVSQSINSNYHIYSVKNSSGEVLTVRDSVNILDQYKGEVSSFSIYDNKIIVHTKGNGLMPFSDYVHPLPKAEVPKTADGYEIVANEIYLSVKDNFEIILISGGSFKKDDNRLKRTFLLKSSAEKFIEDNKPRYSKKQILDAIPSLSDYIGIGGTIQSAINNFKTKLGL